MKKTLRTFLLTVSLPVALAACADHSVADRTLPSIDTRAQPFIGTDTGSDLTSAATGRKRVRDLRGEVTGNVAYLEKHLGTDRAHIMDMQDSLLVTIPGNGAFVGRTSDLSKSGIDAAARVAASMIAYPHTRIAIAGHVQASKSDFADQILSERRAAAVKSVLISRGIDACRIGTLGKGAADPVAEPVSERSNQFNDRVELLLQPFQDGACV